MKKYDSIIIGPVSLDINIDCEGNTRRELGGAVVQAGFAAGRCGFRACVLTKADGGVDVHGRFSGSGADVKVLESEATCSIQNRYLTPDKERRVCTSLSVCDKFTSEDLRTLAGVCAEVYHFAGLVYGDFDGDIFADIPGKIAVDVQGFLRHVEADRTMSFRDWQAKREYLPMIHYLKTDAAEAEILTGESDRYRAAEILAGWGAGEVMITHNTEILIFDGRKFYVCPIKSRNLSGRTGRGDTAFSGYINSRIRKGIPESLLFASALVSLKMETPGPFTETLQDVRDYAEKFYPADSVKVS
ncbi:MAG: hypothetical protein IJS39_04425 [Synergistaceae bacterium]|nr:hypothetical protein [Synergistaceae bacterium]